MNIDPIRKKKKPSVKRMRPMAQESDLDRGHIIQEGVKSAQQEIQKLREQGETLFPIEAFPQRIQNIINCFYETYQLPVDYHCLSILVASSTAIGNAFAAKYRNREVYPVNMYTAIVGPPGIGKTPSIDFGMFPLYKIEKEYQKVFKEKYDLWQAKCEIAKENKESQPLPPPHPDVYVNDFTREALNVVLKNNPRGICVYIDELLGWVKSFNSYRKGNDLEYFLSIWSGKSVKVTRSGNDVLFIEHPFVNVIGGIQPKRLQALINNEKADNGFFDRILFAYPDRFHFPPDTDMDVDESVYELYDGIIRFIWNMPNSFSHHHDPETGEEYTIVERTLVSLTAKAKKAYKAYRNKCKEQQNNAEDESVMGLLSKVMQYCLRIALVLEMLDLACKCAPDEERKEWIQIDWEYVQEIEISEQSVKNAILMMEYFKRSSLKVMEQLESPIKNLPIYQQIWYTNLPESFSRKEAVELAKSMMEEDESVKLSAKTVSRLINNTKFHLFRKLDTGLYQKLYDHIKID